MARVHDGVVKCSIEIVDAGLGMGVPYWCTFSSLEFPAKLLAENEMPSLRIP